MKYIVIGIISFVLVFLVVFSSKLLIKKEIIDIERFEFSTIDGMAMYDGVKYEINYFDNKYIAKIKKNNQSLEDAKEVEISEEKLKGLINILNEYEVSSWDGFDKVDKRVLDGHSFSLYIKSSNGNSISASGYMKCPKNYKELREKLKNYFESL